MIKDAADRMYFQFEAELAIQLERQISPPFGERTIAELEYLRSEVQNPWGMVSAARNPVLRTALVINLLDEVIRLRKELGR